MTVASLYLCRECTCICAVSVRLQNNCQHTQSSVCTILTLLVTCSCLFTVCNMFRPSLNHNLGNAIGVDIYIYIYLFIYKFRPICVSVLMFVNLKCSGFRSFVITHFNAVVSTFHDWFRRIAMNPRDLQVKSCCCAGHSQLSEAPSFIMWGWLSLCFKERDWRNHQCMLRVCKSVC